MIDRLFKLILGGGGLLRAEAQLAAHTFRRVLLATIAIGIALALAAIALIVLAVAGVVMLAGEIGWAPAAAAVSGGILLTSLAVLLIAKLSMPAQTDGSPEDAKRDAEESKREMRAAVTVEDSSEGGMNTAKADGPSMLGQKDWKESATEFVSEHPIEVASAAFAVVALVGPFRTLRLVSRGAAVAGLVGSLMQRGAPDEAPQNGAGANGVAHTPPAPGSPSGEAQARAAVYND